MWIARLVGKNTGGDEMILRGTKGCYHVKRADALYELHNLVAIDLAKRNERRKHEFDMVAQASGGGRVDATDCV
jgi:hypothetical protein